MLRIDFAHLKRDLPVYHNVGTGYLVKHCSAATAVGVAEPTVPRLEVEIEAVAIL